MAILVLIGMVFVIIWEMFHEGLSLNLVLLLLPVYYVTGIKLELMNISLIVNINSNFTHLHGFQLPLLTAIAYKNHFFCLHQQNKSPESKAKVRQASNHCNWVLEAAKLAYVNKTKELIVSQELGSWDFWWITNSVHNKGKSAIPPLFNDLEVLSSAFDKAIFFTKTFYRHSSLDDSGNSLPVFPSRTNLKLHNISVTPKVVKKVITNLALSKVSGPDCIPVVVLKNCESELSCILAELFNMHVKESCFPDCYKFLLVSLYLRMFGKMYN